MMKRIIAIMHKEFQHFTHDTGAMIIMITGVIAYSLFYAIPYSAEVVREVPIGIVDYDQTAMSRDFLHKLDASEYVQIRYTTTSMEELKEEFFKDNIKGFITIPKGFEREIKRGTQTHISLFVDTAYLVVYKSLYAGAMHTAIEYGARIEIAKMLKKGTPLPKAMALKLPFEFVEVPLFNAAGGYETYIYPTILVMILHQTLIVGLGLMQGTRNELREEYCKKEDDIPLTLFARCSFYVLLYLAYSIVVFLLFPIIFKYPMAYNVIPLFILLVFMYYSAAFFSHVLSIFFKTRESALLLLVVTSLVFIFLPGMIWPKESIPMFINVAAVFVPAICGIDGIAKINQLNATFWDIQPDILWLMFLVILYYAMACFILKNSVKKKK